MSHKYVAETPCGPITRRTNRKYTHVVFYTGHPATYPHKKEDGTKDWSRTEFDTSRKVVLHDEWCGRPDLAQKAFNRLRAMQGGPQGREVFMVELKQPAGAESAPTEAESDDAERSEHRLRLMEAGTAELR